MKGKLIRGDTQEELEADHVLKGNVVGLYFAANWVRTGSVRSGCVPGRVVGCGGLPVQVGVGREVGCLFLPLIQSISQSFGTFIDSFVHSLHSVRSLFTSVRPFIFICEFR